MKNLSYFYLITVTFSLVMPVIATSNTGIPALDSLIKPSTNAVMVPSTSVLPVVIAASNVVPTLNGVVSDTQDNPLLQPMWSIENYPTFDVISGAPASANGILQMTIGFSKMPPPNPLDFVPLSTEPPLVAQPAAISEIDFSQLPPNLPQPIIDGFSKASNR